MQWGKQSLSWLCRQKSRIESQKPGLSDVPISEPLLKPGSGSTLAARLGLWHCLSQRQGKGEEWLFEGKWGLLPNGEEGAPGQPEYQMQLVGAGPGLGPARLVIMVSPRISVPVPFSWFFINFYSVLGLHCCVSFRYTAQWFSYTYTHVHASLDSVPIQVIAEYWVPRTTQQALISSLVYI